MAYHWIVLRCCGCILSACVCTTDDDFIDGLKIVEAFCQSNELHSAKLPLDKNIFALYFTVSLAWMAVVFVTRARMKCIWSAHLKSNQIIEIIWHSTDRSSRISTISKAYETETLAQYVNGQFTFPLIFGAYLCSHLFRLSRCNLLPLSL